MVKMDLTHTNNHHAMVTGLVLEGNANELNPSSPSVRMPESISWATPRHWHR